MGKEKTVVGGKKNKIIAASLAGAVVVAGAGVGVGVAISNNGNSTPDKYLEFIVEDQGAITKVYTEDGRQKDLDKLTIGDKICFPVPEATYIGEGAARKYFAGWAEEKAAAVPKYFVGESHITITNTTQSFYPVYMSATIDSLTFDDEDGAAEEYTVAYNGQNLSEHGIVVVPNIYQGKKVTKLVARTFVAESFTDTNGNGKWDDGEKLVDVNGNGQYDADVVAEPFTDNNSNGKYDHGVDSFTDINKNGKWDDVESFTDADEDGIWDAPEAFVDTNDNGRFDAELEEFALKRLIIADGIEEVGEKAFKGCAKLESVVFTNESYSYSENLGGVQIQATVAEDSTVKAIGAKAFEGCLELKSVFIPKTVETIGGEAFYNCKNLKSVEFEEGSKVSQIADAAFRGCENLVSINIPDIVTRIGVKAFSGCKSLQEIEIPNVLVEVGSYAFEGIGVEILDLSRCPVLESLGQGAFQGALSRIIALPETETLASFGKEMFYNATNLERVTTDLTDDENWALPSTVGGTVDAWFRNCQSLQRIDLPKGIDRIFCYAFQNCKSLKEINFHPETYLTNHSVANLDGTAEYNYNYGWIARLFLDCSSLEEIELPMGMQVIDVLTFAGCTNLKKVTFKDPLVRFRAAGTGTGESQIFQGCDNLETVEFAEGASVDCFNWALSWWPETKLTLNCNDAANIGYLFAGCESLKYVGIPNEQGEITVNRLPGYKKVHMSMFQGAGIESFAFEEGVTEIAQFAFAGCTKLKAIDLTGITKLGVQSFAYSGLENVVLPESITEIGYRSFFSLPNVETILFDCKNATVGGDAFQAPFQNEEFEDANGNGVYDAAEEFTDRNGNGVYDLPEEFTDMDGNGVYDAGIDSYIDRNKNNKYDAGDTFVDANENGVWDAAEKYTDRNGNGQYDPEAPLPSKLTTIVFGEHVESIPFPGTGYGSFARCNKVVAIMFTGTTPPDLGGLDLAGLLANSSEGLDAVIVPASEDDSVINAYKAAFPTIANLMIEADAIEAE